MRKNVAWDKPDYGKEGMSEEETKALEAKLKAERRAFRQEIEGEVHHFERTADEFKRVESQPCPSGERA